MSIFLTSLAVIFLAVLVNIFLTPQVLRATAGAGSVASAGGAPEGRALPAFVAMLLLLLGWAYLLLFAAEWLAREDFGQRWVLLIAALGLAGAPYLLYQRRGNNLGTSASLPPPLHSALEYAGGVQSKVVLAGLLSGIYFDWWAYLPG